MRAMGVLSGFFAAPCRVALRMNAMRQAHIVLGVLVVATLAPVAVAAPLARDEQVVFVPATARTLADGRSEVAVEGWIHEVERRPGASRAFARLLGLDLRAMSAEERARFHARTQLFRVDSERGKRIDLRFSDGHTIALPRSGADGRVSARATIDAAVVGADGAIPFEVIADRSAARAFAGRAFHVGAQGLSVVSDIDDTIKQSDVRDRRELLLNTFARPFAAAPGMAEAYRAWATNPDVRFHYVSSSPLQLYPPIAEFIAAAGFPAGSVHLRETTSLHRLLLGGADSRRHKRRSIERLLEDFPQRRFILVGDSGEHDPEIYAELARAHPRQVIAIGIRDVSAEPRSAPRYARAFAGIDAQRWDVFVDPARWQAALPAH